MGKLVTRRVTTKFFDNSQGKMFHPGEIIEIDEDMLISKTRGKRKLVPGVAEANSVSLETPREAIPVAKPRDTGKKDKGASAKPRAKAVEPAEPVDETAEDVQVEEGGKPRDGGSSLLG